MTIQQKTLAAVIVFFTILLVGFIVLDQRSKGHLGGRSGENWQWDDQWNKPELFQLKPKPDKPDVKPDKPEQKPDKPDVKPEKKQQIATTDYTEALKLAKENNMRIVLFLHAPWCQWCNKMEKESFSDAKVQEALKKYVFAKVDTDKNREVATKYKVKGIPALFMLDDKGEVLQNANYMDATKFSNWLTSSKW